jgi:hypothetical protein
MAKPQVRASRRLLTRNSPAASPTSQLQKSLPRNVFGYTFSMYLKEKPSVPNHCTLSQLQLTGGLEHNFGCSFGMLSQHSLIPKATIIPHCFFEIAEIQTCPMLYHQMEQEQPRGCLERGRVHGEK